VAADRRSQAHRVLYFLTVTSSSSSAGLRGADAPELMTPAGDLVQAETYNKLFTAHGVVMVFFFMIPSIPATWEIS
jgi:cytochrome c oxidase subunit 1